MPSDIGSRRETLVRSIYDLTPRLTAERLTGLGEVFPFGRFQGHIDGAGRVLPGVVHSTTVPPGELTVPGGRDCRVSGVALSILTTARHDPVLVLDVALPGDRDAAQVVELMAPTTVDRVRIGIAGRRIMHWLADQLGVPARLAFGRNVHQCVFPGGALRESLLAAAAQGRVPPDAVTLVYRGRVSADRSHQLGVRMPTAVNNPGETLVAHSRGVSVIAGWSEPVENAFALTAMTSVAALGVLHRVRNLAFDALELNQSARLGTTQDARDLLATLSAKLTEVELDLSFGVEGYLDTVLLPEVVTDSFQASMCDVTRIDTGLANSSRMVERLGTVVRTRTAALEAAIQEERERRDRIVTAVVAIGSLIALPPALLLAFFGVTSPDVDPAVSILNLGRYWAAYALAWLPFTMILSAGFWLRRRIGLRNPRVSRPDEEVIEAMAAVVVPAQRTGDQDGSPVRAGHGPGSRRDAPPG